MHKQRLASLFALPILLMLLPAPLIAAPLGVELPEKQRPEKPKPTPVPTVTYVDMVIHNNSPLGSDQVYVFLAAQTSSDTTAPQYPFSIDTKTGIATLASQFSDTRLADLTNGRLRIDSTTLLPSARLYLSSAKTDPTTGLPIIPVSGGIVSSFPPPSPGYYYDFVEFSMTQDKATGVHTLTVDTTQVDQFGLPLTLSVSPGDPINGAQSGTLTTVTRQAIIDNYRSAMQTAGLPAFLDGIIPNDSGADFLLPDLRLLAPQHVIDLQLNPPAPLPGNGVYLNVNIPPGEGTQGNWTSTLTITGPGSPIPTNGGLKTGMYAFGPNLPAGAVITHLNTLSNGAPGQNLTLTSTAHDNPFIHAHDNVGITFYQPPSTALNSHFGPAVNSTTTLNAGNAIDDFFSHWKARPKELRIANTSGNTVNTYEGTVTQVTATDINGTASTYAVLQMNGGGESYNIYYPYFTTNSPAGKTDPFGNLVPPPQPWMVNVNTSPSQMVFAANGVFADNGQQPGKSYTGNSTTLGSLENMIATALVRGYATTWQTRENATLHSIASDGKSAVWQLAKGETQGLSSGMNVSSWKAFSIPMTISAIDTKTDTVTVTTPSSFTGNAGVGLSDLLTFFEMYPATGAPWSAYAKYLHNLMGHEVFIGGRAYALPYDDNGGFSSTLAPTYTPKTILPKTTDTAVRLDIDMGTWH